MAEPTTTASAAVAAAGLLALFPGVDAGIVLGAFSGAAVFVLSAADYSPLQKLAYLALAFFAGVLMATTMAGLIDSLLPAAVEVPAAVGALLASALVIKLLLWLIDGVADPIALLAKIRGAGK